MRWEGGRRSSNVEDRRGEGMANAGAGAIPLLLFRLLPLLLRTRIGRYVLGFAALAVVGAQLLGVDVGSLLLGGGGQQRTSQVDPAQQPLVDFVSVVLADTEDTWQAIFRAHGGRYQEPRLVLFRGSINSACGYAQAAMGPFYCPGDRKLYIDLSFYDDLRSRHGAPGDFAQAYVIAHEVGHHVQNLLGISTKVQQSQQKASQVQANQLSVRLELQADCFAGVWGYHANRDRQLLDPEDIDEALTAASAIGDDRLQQQAGRRVTPDSFTHGSSEQRVRWFRQGFTSGTLESCDTFSSKSL